MSISIVSNTENISRSTRARHSAKRLFENLAEFKNVISDLTKFRITFFVSVTTTVGFLLFDGKVNFDLFITALGVLILASGASSLNEYQERNTDNKMSRTKTRPIPSGRISANSALMISVFFILIGSIVLASISLEVMFVGLFTLIWYNVIYTPLKYKTAFAIIPGSLVGSLPPVIGWLAAGGNLFDQEIIVLASFLFIWQIPHFWLLLLIYDNQYKEAGFPTLSKIFSENQIKIMTYFWIVILALSSLFFIQVNLSIGIISNLLLYVFGFSVIFYSLKIFKKKQNDIFRKSFLMINLYVLCVLILITIENIIYKI